MGDEGELWNIIREKSRIYKENNRGEQYPLLEKLIECGKAKMITPYQFRILNRIDIFPSNKKYHDIKTNKRGRFNNLIDFLILWKTKKH